MTEHEMIVWAFRLANISLGLTVLNCFAMAIGLWLALSRRKR